MAPRVNLEPPAEYPDKDAYDDNDVDDHRFVNHMSVGNDYFRAACEVVFPTITHLVQVSTKLCRSIAPSVLTFLRWLILFLLQDIAVAFSLGVAYILRLFAEYAENLATFLKSTKSTMQAVRRSEIDNPSPKALPVQYAESTTSVVSHESEEEGGDDCTNETQLRERAFRRGRATVSVLTKREEGLERVRALHQWRRRRGLKVCVNDER